MVRLIPIATLVYIPLLSSLVTAQPLPDVVNERPLVIEGAKARVLALALSPDGKLLASGGYDRTRDDSGRIAVLIWNLATHKQVRELAIDCDDVHAIAFDSSGSRIAIGDRSGLVSCWNVATGAHLFTTPKSDAEIKGVAFSRDGKKVISGGDKFCVWDSASGRQLGAVNTPNDWAVNRMSMSQDGAVLVAACGSEGTVLNAATLRPIQILRGHGASVDAIAISVSKRRVATGCNDGSVKVWDARSGKNLLTLKGHAEPVACLAFLDEDRRLVSGGDEGKLRIWDLATGKQEQQIDASTLAVDALVVSRDGTVLVNNDILRIHVRQIGQGAAGGKAETTQPAAPQKNADLNNLRNWEVVRGDWKQQGGRLVGAGDSRVNFRQTFPNDLLFRCKLLVNGPTNPRIRFGSFHFGYEGTNQRFFLHGPQATGEPFPFEFGKEYSVEVRIVNNQATLRIDGKEVARSNPAMKDDRTISLEGGGKRSRSSAEFFEMEVVTSVSFGWMRPRPTASR